MSQAKSEVLILGPQLREERDYWIGRLSRERTVSGLPADHPRPARRPVRSAMIAMEIPDDLFRSLSKLTGNGPFLIYTTLCAALQICLARYAGTSTIVIGSPARKLESADPTSNALAIVGEIQEQELFNHLLKAARQTLLDAYARQQYPFHRLLADLGYGVAEQQCPLFSVLLALRDIHDELPEVSHDVNITFNLGADPLPGLAGEIAFDPALFESSTIERFARQYLNVLRSALADPQTPVRELEMLDEADRALLAGWSRGPSLETMGRTVHQLIEAQAERTPDAPAVLSGNDRLSYRELDSAANRLARHLRRLGVTAESRVAIAMDSSPQAMVAILAALKAGAAYVPLDPKHPKDRLKTILSNLRPTALITVEDLLPGLPEHGARIVLVDRDREAIARESAASPAGGSGEEGLAYVIYTSGSTGVPNGVMVSHRALVNRAHAMRQIFDLDGATRQLQFASLTFDMSCEEILATWIFGGAVVLLSAQQRQSGLGILAECDRLGVTKINLAASVWHNLVDEMVAAGRGVPRSLKVSVAGAESPSLEKLRTWNGLALYPLRFFNIYGPTEGTIMATFFEVALGAGALTGDLDRLTRLPIGRPLPDTRLHLLDAHLRPVPIGVPGELHIGGIALARGYLDRPDVTARTFIPDPWSETAGARLYKTGDLARYAASGLLEFFGRIDFQVKIRGFRVELEEIEATLRQHPAVRQAVVLAREDIPGDKRLAAYVVSAESTPFDVEELRRHLLGRLPEHMVPRIFVELGEIPLLASGKIDRQALPAPDRAGVDRSSFVAPSTPIERWLAEIWADLLRVERIGTTDDFFKLGGHSLLAMQLVSYINETFEVELPPQRVFELPTVAELAAQIEAARGSAPEAPPLVPVPRGQRLPLSYSQQRLWFIDQLEPGNSFYNVPSVVRLTGRLDVTALEKSLNGIIKRHEVLRTTFVADGGRPLQQIHPELKLPLPILDVSSAPASEREAAARALIDEAVRHPFDLTRGPLLQAILIRLAKDDHLLLVNAHHIVCDAWSIGIFNHELTELYRAALEGRRPQLPELPIQFADFSHWQHQWLTGERLGQQVQYWQERLAGANFDLGLPTDRPRPSLPSFRGAFHPLALSRPVTAAARRLSRDHGVTLFMPLLTAFVALLYRYTGQRDLVVGSPIANRNHTQTEPLIGFFLNTIVLRVPITGDPHFLALLDRVRDVALGAFAHQDLPFEKLIEELDVERDLSRQSLFQVMFVLQNATIEPLNLPGLQLAPIEVATETAKFDLTLSLTEGGDHLGGGVEYSTDLFDATTIGRFAGHLDRLLEAIIADLECRISDLPLLSTAEIQQLTGDWNDTRKELPSQASIHALFEVQAARTPTATAVISPDETLSYAELNARANRLAHGLLRLGVVPEDRVGICMQRSSAMPVALLAVLKAGGAYVPLDPGYPRERLDFMVDDAGISALVLGPESPLSQGSLPRLTVDAGGRVEDEASLPDTDPPATAGPHHLAYVMYTSGSTGLPKGVEVPHAGVLRLLWQADYATLDGRQTLLQAAPMSFDASTLEIWGALLLGGRCVLMPDETPTAQSLRAVIGRHGVDTLWLTSSLFNAVVDEDLEALSGVGQLLIGGEALSVPHVGRYREHFPHTALVNGYGPTENTTFTCCYKIPTTLGSAASIPIGRPIVNTRVYVLDHHLQPVGLGIVGELYVAGQGLARGYLSRPSLTSERFLPDPFSQEEGARLYRTGDLVRWRFPTLIEFVGRRDQQVKVRGHRIELGEIESVLKSHAAITDAVVLVREDQPGQKLLVAFVTAEGDATPKTEEILGFLKAKLPDYMVPRACVTLQAMPLTPSGKIDRQALQATNLTLDDAGYEPPTTPTEERMAGIWAALLGRERIGRHDDFFALGGHSLLATQVVSRVRQLFSIEVSVRSLFENPKLSSFALYVLRTGAEGGPQSRIELQRVPRDGDLPLSFAQRRLWYLIHLEPESPAFNMPVAVRLAGRLDTAALIRSLDEIKQRHEVLRTSFPAVGGEPVQRIAEAASFPLERVDLTPISEEQRDAEAMRRAEHASRQLFDLSTGPLIRGLLLRLREEEHVLVLAISHIVSDGWSMGVLTRELGQLYDAFAQGLPSPLPELPIQYADFAHWQRQWLSEEVLEAQLQYWRRRLRGAPELLELPSDRPRPEVQSFAGASEHFIWSEKLSTALHRLGRDQDATLFMTLLAAFQILLYRYSGQLDFCIGVAVANRTREETEALVGCFINTLVMRAELEHHPTFRELLSEVREVALSAYAHQDVPFDMVVEALRPKRAAGYSPFVQVMFDLESARGREELQLPGLTLSVINTPLGTSKRDLTLSLTDTGDLLHGGFSYSSDLFDATTIRRLVARLEVLVASILEQPDLRIDELEILSEAEKQQLAREQEVRRSVRRALLLGQEEEQPLSAELGRAFWRRQGGSSYADPLLPFAAGTPRAEACEPAVLVRALPPDLSVRIEVLAAQRESSVAVVLQAAWQTLLWRLVEPPDVVVATAFDCRELAPLDAALGLFARWLPVRVRFTPDLRFHELLRQIDRFTSEASEWQSYFVPTADRAYFPLGFDYQEGPATHTAGRVSISHHDVYLCADRFDLRLSCLRAGGGLTLALYYATDRFRATDVTRLAEQLETLLRSVSATPEARIGELEVMSEAARHQLLVAWNDFCPETPPGADGIHLLFEQQAERTPANVAVVGEGGQLTFAELDARANQLANFLRRRGVGPEVLVALCLPPTEEMVVTLLGVLKAGGAYLPLEPGAPRESLRFALEDARPKLLVTLAKLCPELPVDRPETVLLDADGPTIAQESSARPASRTVPDHLLYVIYTSGSTGRPKGVLIAHRQMLNYVASLGSRLDLPPGAGYALVSTFAADLGCTMLYPALASGGCLHVLPKERAADPAALAEYFEHHSIDALKIVPSHLAALMAHSRPGAVLPRRRLVLGGEASRWEWIEKIQALAPDCVVLNHYGPTETTVGVMTRQLTRAAGRRGPVPLGHPIANTQVYVLDRHLRPVPVWVPGQIHIGGVALARGYLNRPELTAERFIPDPFSRTPGGRLYTTGDLARHLPEDAIEFLGRTDHQIKLRGFRIELGEIESVLLEHPRVREAIVVVREEPDGDRRLVAYVVSGSPREPAPPASEFRELLRERLPEPMVPAAFVTLSDLPLTPNGKVDRSALAALVETHREPEKITVPPRDALEIQLVQIWQDLLGVQPIGIHDNFFDLGGHSLLMVTMMARIKAATGRMPPLAALLQQVTIAGLASVLRQEVDGPQPALVRMQPRGTRKPFFCVHPAGGMVLSYLELARQMAPDQPFYALQADGREKEGHRRLEDLAARYLADVLAAQPEGPYYLGGHSFGGVVAYEMARQLEAQGRTVALLVLLDSAPASPGERRAQDHDAFLMANFALHLGLPVDERLLASKELAELTTDEQLAEVLRRAKQAGLVPSDLRHDEARRRFELLESHVEARLRYVPPPYRGRVTLFRAHEQLLAAAALSRQPQLVEAVRQLVSTVADPSMGWGGLAADGVEVHELPGDHFSMLRPPHVSALAGELRLCLEQATCRIERREIKAALERHPEIAEAVVTGTDAGSGTRRSWAYVVPRQAAASGPPLRLPSGLEVFHLNQNEAEHLYRQIFESNIYLRHGIALPEEACILDVGANIGLFTLFVHCVSPRPRVFAFEPSPPAFERLRKNTELYGLAVELQPCAVSDREGVAPFTIYSRASVMSGLYADPRQEERLFRTFVEEQLRATDDPQLVAQVIDRMAAGRFAVKVVDIPLRTISSVIKEHAIERVDLLKVDAEKSELDIFSGIAPADWAKIQQVTAEIHTADWLTSVVALLEAQGFTVVTEQDSTMRATGIHHVYARRPRPAHSNGWHDRPQRSLERRAMPPAAPTAAEEPLRESLRELLLRELPHAVMPAGFTLLDELPRRADGQVDRAGLPEPEAP